MFRAAGWTGLLFDGVGEAVETSHVPLWSEGDLGSPAESFVIQRHETAIQILITNPQEVTIDYMRRIIAKEYARLRRGVPRRQWGERSGRKERLAERNRWYQTEYRRLRARGRAVGAERVMETLLEEGKKTFGRLGEISLARLKRLLYVRNGVGVD